MWTGAQPAPGPLTLGVTRLAVGTPEVMDAVMQPVSVSPEVREHVDSTHRLMETVGRLTERLERESDTALLAISGWGWMPSTGRFR